LFDTDLAVGREFGDDEFGIARPAKRFDDVGWSRRGHTVKRTD
jgi:hypothetical protein